MTVLKRLDVKIFVVTMKRFVCRLPRGTVPMASRLRGFVDPQILRCKFTVHTDLCTSSRQLQYQCLTK